MANMGRLATDRAACSFAVCEVSLLDLHPFSILFFKYHLWKISTLHFEDITLFFTQRST